METQDERLKRAQENPPAKSITWLIVFAIIAGIHALSAVYAWSQSSVGGVVLALIGVVLAISFALLQIPRAYSEWQEHLRLMDEADTIHHDNRIHNL